MTTLVFAKIAIHDRAGYDEYAALALPLFMREGVKVLANDEAPRPLSPDMATDKCVLLEFRDDAHMKAFFTMPEYLEAGKIRDAATTMSAIRFQKL